MPPNHLLSDGTACAGPSHCSDPALLYCNVEMGLQGLFAIYVLKEQQQMPGTQSLHCPLIWLLVLALTGVLLTHHTCLFLQLLP